MSLCSNGMVNMGCRGVEWETWAKYFIKETSAVYRMRVFATFCLSSGAVLPLYAPSSQSCLRSLHTGTPSLHTLQQPSFSKKEQNKGILMACEKPSHFVTEAREWRSLSASKSVWVNLELSYKWGEVYSWPRKYQDTSSQAELSQQCWHFVPWLAFSDTVKHSKDYSPKKDSQSKKKPLKWLIYIFGPNLINLCCAFQG